MPGARDIKAGEAYVTLSTRERLARGLNAGLRRVQAFGKEVTKVGKGLIGVGATITAPIAAAVREFTKVGDSLDKAAARTGLTTNALSELGFAAEQSGSSTGDLEKGVRSMQRSVTDLGRGLSTQLAAFDRLGLSYEELASLAPEDQFELIADRLALLQNDTLRVATATQIFGRAGSQLLPLFQQGADGIRALREQARNLDLSIDPQDARAAAELTDQLNILSRILRVTLFSAGQAVAPLMTELVRRIQGGASAFKDFIRENERLVVGLAKLGGLLTALGTGLVTLGALAASLGAIATLLSPIGIAATLTVPAVLGLVAAFNGGTIAGVDFGKAMLQLASDLGLVKNAALDLENAENRVARAAQSVARAERDLEDATGIREKLRVTDRLVQALERQTKARRELVRAELDADPAVIRARRNLSLTEGALGAGGPFASGSTEEDVERARAALEKAEADFFNRPDPIADGLDARLAEVRDQANQLRASLADIAVADDGSVSALTERLERLKNEAAELETQLASVRDTGGPDSDAVIALSDRLARVRVEARVAQAELAALQDQAAEAIVPRITTDGQGLFDTLGDLVSQALDRVRERVGDRLDLELQISLFGADADETAILQIEEQTRRLKEQARELGILTPRLEQQIEAGARRSLAQALEVQVDAPDFTVSRQGIFDTRALQGLVGGTVDYQQLTATNTKRTAEAVERLSDNGTLRFTQ